VNVILQALAHVVPVRDFFLQPHKYEEKVERSPQGPLVLRFGEVVRRLWSKDNFKSTVSPHDFLQEAASASKKHFRIGKQGDAIEFLSWLLNCLHLVRAGLSCLVLSCLRKGPACLINYVYPSPPILPPHRT
jgi:U4/U6.U5 tri-snRNP-associated protein 2